MCHLRTSFQPEFPSSSTIEPPDIMSNATNNIDLLSSIDWLVGWLLGFAWLTGWLVFSVCGLSNMSITFIDLRV